MSAVLPLRSASKLRALRAWVQSIDLRAVARWLYIHRVRVGIGWALFGLLLTFALLSAVWYVGGSAATPAGMAQGPFGMVNVPAQPAVPGLGHALVTHWWGWLALALFVPVFTAFSPLLVAGLPLLVLGVALGIVFAPLGVGVTLTLAPLAMLTNAPTSFLSKLLEAIGLGERISGLAATLRRALGLSNSPRRNSQGQAVTMDSEDFARYAAKPKRGAPMLVGAFDDQSFSGQTEKHGLIVAPTRAGKGRDLILGNLLSYPGSVFVLDPKGENATLTAGPRAKLGEVHVLDPFGTTNIPSSRWNPLALLRAGDYLVTDAQMLAEALIMGDDTDHWLNSARQLLTGLMLHVATAPDLPTRDLPTVRSLLMVDLKTTLAAMAKNDAAGGVIKRIAGWALQTDPKEWGSVVSTASVQTQWLDAPQLAAVLRDGGAQVDFAKYLNGVQSVYVCLPAPYFATYSHWLRMLTACAVDTMTKRLTKLPHPVRFVLDELAQLGYLEKVESALTLSAGYGVQLWGVWQHISDIARCYPKAGIGGWVSCSGVRMVFNAFDNATVDYFTKASAGALTEADVRQIPDSHMLVLVDGQNPAIVQRVPVSLPMPGAPAPALSISTPAPQPVAVETPAHTSEQPEEWPPTLPPIGDAVPAPETSLETTQEPPPATPNAAGLMRVRRRKGNPPEAGMPAQ